MKLTTVMIVVVTIVTVLFVIFFQEFENVECEWPLFYIFMIMDGVFKGLPAQVEEYKNLLANVICKDLNGGRYFSE